MAEGKASDSSLTGAKKKKRTPSASLFCSGSISFAWRECVSSVAEERMRKEMGLLQPKTRI
ncbi:hypothetical protein RvY_04621 [Ramazzottius varieornatus]|uniref:Uncharacterized protein n=1 Tax=Ramazzottius varieornatus TaxID=947166 RepID=A0A1D1US89_RAMVA|nr:hypothetical protein RvY_04621 [Ramazzottius varieornatus]